ncbi:hypothetical protein DFH09DRAFT_947053 [Mycena vulgaris]|nr:hypothetical protein DFH09DRAFT_947053 [Mycena vulgaris]
MDGSRSSTSTRLRTQALPNIVDDANLFGTSASRKEAFSADLGYFKDPDSNDWHYKPLKVPILYDVYNGAIDLDHIFRGPVLLKVFPFHLPFYHSHSFKIYASLIRGPRGAVGLFEGNSRRPQAKCVESIYRIRRTSPGAIANAAVLAIWLHSPDTELLLAGNESEINYGKRYEIYLERICVGLRDGKRWVRELFTYWDSIIFPHANDSLGQVVSASQQAEQDELDNAMDVFDDAPSASPVGHQLYLFFSHLRVHLDAISTPFPTPHTRAGLQTRAAPSNSVAFEPATSVASAGRAELHSA